MNFKLIVFDWDGTLMDSEARIVDCMQTAIAEAGLPAPSRQAVRNIIGLGLLEAVRALLPDHPAETHVEIKDRYRLRYLGAAGAPTPLFEGADEVVRGLAEAGYLLAVATGKGRQGLDHALQSCGLGAFFHTTRCADETFSKPHPDMLLQIMDEMGVEPHETLMVGDTEFDMQLAGNARAHALAVSYGVHERGRLMNYPVLGCVDDVREIPTWLVGVSEQKNQVSAVSV